MENINKAIESLNTEHDTLTVDFNNGIYTGCQFERLSDNITNRVLELLETKKNMQIESVIEDINIEWIADDIDEGMDLDINME